MADAAEIANRLAYKFLCAGQYSASSGPVEVSWLRAASAAMDNGHESEFEVCTPRFSGLSVQSVGVEEGIDDPKVHIYLTLGSAKQIKSLPQEIDGVAIRAHKMGAITIRSEATHLSTNRGNIYERNNRICCGSSCGPTSERSSGTLGALVKIGALQNIYLLSNNHVFAGCNHVPQNQPILAPSSSDGRADARAPHEIGRHHMICELRSGDPNFVQPCHTDLALARVTNNANVSSWQGDEINGYDTPNMIAEPMSLMRVKKFGRTTGLTFGEIEAKISTPMPVTYNAKHFKGVVWFKNVWTVRVTTESDHFALPGDSGSLVVSEDSLNAIGLVFAANSTGEYAWIVPMSSVIEAFEGLHLHNNHGVYHDT